MAWRLNQYWCPPRVLVCIWTWTFATHLPQQHCACIPCIALNYTTLHCTRLFYTTLHYTTPHYTTLCHTKPRYTTTNYTTPYHTVSNHTTPYYTALNHTNNSLHRMCLLCSHGQKGESSLRTYNQANGDNCAGSLAQYSTVHLNTRNKIKPKARVNAQW